MNHDRLVSCHTTTSGNTLILLCVLCLILSPMLPRAAAIIESGDIWEDDCHLFLCPEVSQCPEDSVLSNSFDDDFSIDFEADYTHEGLDELIEDVDVADGVGGSDGDGISATSDNPFDDVHIEALGPIQFSTRNQAITTTTAATPISSAVIQMEKLNRIRRQLSFNNTKTSSSSSSSDSKFSDQELHDRCCGQQQQCICRSCPSMPKCPIGEVALEVSVGNDRPGSCCTTYTCAAKPICSGGGSSLVSFWHDSCTKCNCIKGYEMCHQYCQHDAPLGAGAMICYSSYLRKLMGNGDTWLEDNDCSECKCENGKNRCYTSFCKPAECADPVKIPGKCCPVCQEKQIEDEEDEKHDNETVIENTSEEVIMMNSSVLISSTTTTATTTGGATVEINDVSNSTTIKVDMDSTITTTSSSGVSVTENSTMGSSSSLAFDTTESSDNTTIEEIDQNSEITAELSSSTEQSSTEKINSESMETTIEPSSLESQSPNPEDVNTLSTSSSTAATTIEDETELITEIKIETSPANIIEESSTTTTTTTTTSTTTTESVTVSNLPEILSASSSEASDSSSTTSTVSSSTSSTKPTITFTDSPISSTTTAAPSVSSTIINTSAAAPSTSAPPPLTPESNSYRQNAPISEKDYRMAISSPPNSHNVLSDFNTLLLGGAVFGMLVLVASGVTAWYKIHNNKQRKTFYSSVPNSETNLSETTTNTVLAV